MSKRTDRISTARPQRMAQHSDIEPSAAAVSPEMTRKTGVKRRAVPAELGDEGFESWGASGASSEWGGEQEPEGQVLDSATASGGARASAPGSRKKSKHGCIQQLSDDDDEVCQGAVRTEAVTRHPCDRRGCSSMRA